MPLVSRLGAASSRGFGQFTQTGSQLYVEDVFNTWLYEGNGSSKTISNGMPFSSTSTWSTYKNQQGTTYNNGVTSDSSGNIYVVGQANDGATYAFVIKYNSLGVVQWQRKIRQNATATGGITVDSSGNVYIVASTYDASAYYILVAKYDSSGALQWQRKLQENNSYGRCIDVDSSGNVYVGGSADDGSVYGIVAKYNSSGTLQWQRRFRQGGTFIRGLSVDSSGNPHIVGYANDGTVYMFVAKYSTSGSLLWQRKIIDGNGNYGLGISVDSSGNVYATGYPIWVSNGRFYIILIKYNSSGSVQWQRKLSHSTGNAFGMGVGTDSAGDIYVCGYSSSGNSPGLFAKYNSSGTLQWQREFSNGEVITTSINSKVSGTLLISGYAYGTAGPYYGYVASMSSNGSTTGGTAFLTLNPGTLVEAAGTAVDSSGTAVDSAGTATETAGGATDSAGTLTLSSATQSAVTSNGGLVWIKSRTNDNGHILYDTVRGAYPTGAYLGSNETNASSLTNAALYAKLTSFNIDGFTLGTTSSLNVPNISGEKYVAWSFLRAPKFFDVVTYTGDLNPRLISHNLGVPAGMILVKRVDSASSWYVFHRWGGIYYYLTLNGTGAKVFDTNIWNGQNQESTGFPVGASSLSNASGAQYVAYVFAHDETVDGVVQCGTFTTNGSGNATVNLGWEPQFVLIKRTDSATNGEWQTVDTMRGFSRLSDNVLYPNNTLVEDTGDTKYKPNSTGFDVVGSSFNATYVYIAVRRGLMRRPTDATKVFELTTYTGSGSDQSVNTPSNSFVYDSLLQKGRSGTLTGYAGYGFWASKLQKMSTSNGSTGGLGPAVTDTEAVGGIVNYSDTYFSLSSFTSLNNSGTPYINYWFRRATGFFDVVCYTGTGSARTVSHNLGVAPELMITKSRSSVANWWVFQKNLTTNILLNGTAADGVLSLHYGSPTTTNYSIFASANGTVNDSGATYVAYLFATCPGVSKVGSYTGTGTTKQIDCGFTAGARFILIKRTDSAGDWYLYDSVRGIVAGDDPYLLLNSTAAEVTGTDYIDTYAAGFELSSTAPAGLNANGGTYLFLAIA